MATADRPGTTTSYLEFARGEAMAAGDLDWEGLPTKSDSGRFVESIDTVVPEWNEPYLRRVQEAIRSAGSDMADRASSGLDRSFDEQATDGARNVRELGRELSSLLDKAKASRGTTSTRPEEPSS